jgi:hypothetical protein
MLAASVRYGFVCYAQRSEDAETDDRSARQVTRYVGAFRRIAGQGKSLRFAVVSAPKHDQDLRPSRFSPASFFQHFFDLLRRRARQQKKARAYVDGRTYTVRVDDAYVIQLTKR